MFRRGQSGFRLRLRLRRGDGGGEPRCEIGTVASLQRQGTPNSQVNGDGETAGVGRRISDGMTACSDGLGSENFSPNGLLQHVGVSLYSGIDNLFSDKPYSSFRESRK